MKYCFTCGAPLLDDATGTCPACNAPIGPSAPQEPAAAAPPPPLAYPPAVMGPPAYGYQVVLTKSKSTAILLEVLPAVFTGLMGIGWLYAGYTNKGIILLASSFAWWLIFGCIVLVTFGLGAFCWPLVWVGALISTIMLNDAMKAEPHRFH
ncbi:MAG: hypothetical protein K1X39_01640 [Thermoflexales bacterium]|nr:hypothetical protein [Thermoflexales bacterium]